MAADDATAGLQERLDACDRVMAIAAAHGERVPSIAARRRQLAAELGLVTRPARRAAAPRLHRPRRALLTCEDCGRPWDRDGCVFDPFPELGWVGM